jgi:MFS family permease
MFQVLGSAWALLLGMMLLMIGNGLQGTLLGLRGAIEGFSTLEMSIVMSSYFVGFLGGSRMAPLMIRRVGHVRVFAALGSIISAVLVLYPTLTDPAAWSFLRIIFGFCFSGVYVTAESWLNNATTNDNRGKALSAYMIVQMAGITIAQIIITQGDPSGYVLFIIPSVLVSLSFMPILLSVNPTPAFDTTKPMTLRQLWVASPTGCVGMLLMGGVFSAQFGMSAVYGSLAGLSVTQISTFVAVIYIGGLLLQYPIGWLSDRMDRRKLIMYTAAAGCVSSLIGAAFGGQFLVLLVAAFLIGGLANPLYALLIAYTNDYLEYEDMAAASGGMVFINGVGAIAGPLIVGWLMGFAGPRGFWIYLAALMLALSVYSLWRMTQRPSKSIDDTASYTPLSPTSTPVAIEAAQEYDCENAQDGERSDET